ncbi:MAG: AMP-binding protein, partial [Ktedonobacteraceae bacterium]|nr:AMP-binding protein [Ktedonobacteraceae bacterium]
MLFHASYCSAKGRLTMLNSHMTSYEEERRTFHLDVPEHFNFATNVIDRWAQNPNKLAMLWIGPQGQEQHLTFAYFSERAHRAANAFTRLGIQKGQRVMVMLPRLPEWWEAVLGLIKLGAIFIPCTTLLTPKDIQYRAEIAEVQGFITDSEGAAKFDQVRDSCPTVKHTILVDNGSERAH